jgi:hypothetical protein
MLVVGISYTILVVQRLPLVSNTVAEKAQVTGLPNGAYDLFISTRDKFSEYKQSFDITDNKLLFDLPGFSVALLKTHH